MIEAWVWTVAETYRPQKAGLWTASGLGHKKGGDWVLSFVTRLAGGVLRRGRLPSSRLRKRDMCDWSTHASIVLTFITDPTGLIFSVHVRKTVKSFRNPKQHGREYTQTMRILNRSKCQLRPGEVNLLCHRVGRLGSPSRNSDVRLRHARPKGVPASSVPSLKQVNRHCVCWKWSPRRVGWLLRFLELLGSLSSDPIGAKFTCYSKLQCLCAIQHCHSSPWACLPQTQSFTPPGRLPLCCTELLHSWNRQGHLTFFWKCSL